MKDHEAVTSPPTLSGRAEVVSIVAPGVEAAARVAFTSTRLFTLPLELRLVKRSSVCHFGQHSEC